VQIGFVDDPMQAVQKADELVAQVMKSLAETFADERANIEGDVDHEDTEHLRVALRRYRSFFQRLLSL
jgi:CHAD domain-containing protein